MKDEVFPMFEGGSQRLVTVNLDDLASVRQCLELWLADGGCSKARPFVLRAFESLMQEVETSRTDVILAGIAVREAREQLASLRAKRRRRQPKPAKPTRKARL